MYVYFTTAPLAKSFIFAVKLFHTMLWVSHIAVPLTTLHHTSVALVSSAGSVSNT